MERYMNDLKIIELGKQLVKELGLENSTDTLARWMAHHIAELIDKSESNNHKKNSQLKSECFESILKLWKHRAHFPNGKRPFEYLESVVETLDKIKLSNQNPYYFLDTVSFVEKDLHDLNSSDIKNQIKSIDLTARTLIGYLLKLLSKKNSNSPNIDWSRFEEFLEKEDFAILKIRTEFGDDDQDAIHDDITVKIAHLDNFIKLSQEIRESLVSTLRK